MLGLSSRRLRASRGFTLLELLVGAAAASIFLAGTGYIVINAMRSERRISGISEVQGELSQAIDFIQRDLNEAVFVYNDQAEPPAIAGDPPEVDDDNGDGFVEGDGIPDLNQVIWDRGLTPNTGNADRVPVLGFWKIEPLSSRCITGGGTFQPFVQQLSFTRNSYALVVYTHLRVLPSDIWEGTSVIARAIMRPYNADCDAAVFPFVDPSDPNNLILPDPTNFYTWPDPVPPGTHNVNNITLIDNIRFGDRIGAPTSTAVLPAPACPVGYSYGGGDPAESPPVPDAGFYTCVSIPRGREPQDVQIFLTANSMRQADPTLFGQYEGRTFASLGPGEVGRVSRYIHSLQSQLFIRGVVDRPD